MRIFLKYNWRTLFPWLILLLILSVASGLLPALLLLFFGKTIDHILNGSALKIIIITGSIFVMTFLADKLMIPLRNYTQIGCSMTISKEAKKSIASKYQAFDYEEILQKNIDNLYENATNAVDKATKLFSDFFDNLRTLLTLLSYMFILYTVTKLGFIVLIATFLLIVYKNLSFSKKIYKLDEKQSRNRRRLDNYHEILTGYEYQKERVLYKYANHFSNRWTALYEIMMKNKLKVLSRGLVSTGLFQSLQILLTFLLLLFIIQSKNSSIGQLVIMFQIVNEVIGKSNSFSFEIRNLLQSALAFKHLGNFLRMDKKENNTNIIEVKDVKEMELRNVSYQYPSANRATLENIHLTIKQGDMIGIVGVNGAGKTTLCHLLSGLLRPTNGEIVVNGISNIVTSKMRIGATIYRDFIKYPLNLKKNIHLSDEPPTESMRFVKDIYDECGEHILGSGYENSLELSGGQWQRVAIARGVAKGNKFMILDEPTAAMDPIQEELTLNQLKSLASFGYTFLMVSHRINPIMRCNKVIVLENGRITQSGSPEELLQVEGLFKNIYHSQLALLQKENNVQTH